MSSAIPEVNVTTSEDEKTTVTVYPGTADSDDLEEIVVDVKLHRPDRAASSDRPGGPHGAPMAPPGSGMGSGGARPASSGGAAPASANGSGNPADASRTGGGLPTSPGGAGGGSGAGAAAGPGAGGAGTGSKAAGGATNGSGTAANAATSRPSSADTAKGASDSGSGMPQLPQLPQMPDMSAFSGLFSGFASAFTSLLGTMGQGSPTSSAPNQVNTSPLSSASNTANSNWDGSSNNAYQGKNTSQQDQSARLNAVDDKLQQALGMSAQNTAEGRQKIQNIIQDVNEKIASLGPAANTPAGQAAILALLQQKLAEAGGVVTDANRKSVENAAFVRELTAEYAKEAGESTAESKPGDARGAIDASQVDFSGKGTYPSGEAEMKKAIAKALDAKGITDPVARANWEKGMLTIAQRESGYNSPTSLVNMWDSNATGATQADGAPFNSSRGAMQTIPSTFAAHHQAGTSTSIYDPVANSAASMNYIMSRYGVSADGSNLAALVPQANPNASPRGY